MALRNIIKIDEEKCNGCGKCVTACAEGVVRIVEQAVSTSTLQLPFDDVTISLNGDVINTETVGP